MRDYIYIGSSPPDEDCVVVSDKEPYLAAMRAECKRYIEAIRQKLGMEQGSARLTIKSENHDFGPYLEVVCQFNDDDQVGAAYALLAEGDGPMTWDDVTPMPPDQLPIDLRDGYTPYTPPANHSIPAMTIGAVLAHKQAS